ncbi:MAG TPA: hypothetical protein VKA27_14875 [Sunxiuqinia sp.]|nr:hypothetical protein [Sunxiuqinia sp.]
MEKDKLIKIILKDLEELNEIAAGLNSSGDLTKLELDIAVSKSKLVYQEFEFLNDLNRAQFKNTPPHPVTVSSPVIPEEKVVEEAQHEVSKEEPVVEKQEEKTEAQKSEEVVEEKPVQPEPEEATKDEEIEPDKIVEDQSEPEATMNETADEDETEEPQQKRVGDNFVKGKSLNDLLIEGKRLDAKLAGSPINKLETAIGLNDRFQFTRELFKNNPDLFRKTIQQIDQSSNLDEAVNYLNSNFKWKKTEISIQFAQLVKRRFSK